MPARLARLWVPAAVAGTAALAAVVRAHPGPLLGERRYVAALQRLGEPVPSLAEAVRVTTGSEACLVVLALPAAWALWRWRARGALVVAIPVATMLAVQPLVKDIVDRPRPQPTQVEVRAAKSSTSFPSGHSMSTTAVWGVAVGAALARRRTRLAAALGLPIALTFLSGGVQGLHWPSDAVGGTLLGAVSAKATLAAARWAAPGGTRDGPGGGQPSPRRAARRASSSSDTSSTCVATNHW